MHVAIVHKVINNYIDDYDLNHDKPMIIKLEGKQYTPRTAFHKPLNAPGVTPAGGTGNNELSPIPDCAFDCPLCPLIVSQASKRSHMTKHYYAQISAEVTSSPPFECHLCRHIAQTRSDLIKHVGVFHQLVDRYIQDPTNQSHDSETEVKLEASEVSGMEPSVGAAENNGSEGQRPESRTLEVTGGAGAASAAASVYAVRTEPCGTHTAECRLCERPQYFR